MEYLQLTAKPRQEKGKGASRRLRRAGLVPAIIYGANQDALPINLDHNTIFHALRQEKFHTSILTINLDGKVEKVLLRDFQRHPYLMQVLHLDFQRVNEQEEIDIKVPVHFLNSDIAHAVKVQGARVTHILTEIEIRALPSNIPSFIEVDLKNIKAGQALHLSDLKLPAQVLAVPLLRNDDQVVAIAASITEKEESSEAVAISDIPTSGRKPQE